jgi:hypothetical protein
MTDTNLLDDPIIVNSIHKASEELLRHNRNKEKTTMSTAITMPTIGTMSMTRPIPMESVRRELLRRVNELSASDCTKVLRFVKTLESEWSDEEWNELCDEFERSPETAVAKAERRAGFPKQS